MIGIVYQDVVDDHHDLDLRCGITDAPSMVRISQRDVEILHHRYELYKWMFTCISLEAPSIRLSSKSGA